MDASTRAALTSALTVIEAEEVVLPGGELKKGPVYVSIVQDTITDITSTRPPTVKDVIKTHLLTPGFIDLHIHGLGGTNDVIDFWSNPGYTLSRLPMGGTTSCLATIVLPKSSSQPNTLQLFDKLKDVIGRTNTGGAVLEGINAEGPLVNDFGGLPESER
uniref:Amidohydrolase-related domain-containing protein n=1 Tax=Amphimedon queenslandica TaxID=400682 RepID=A0A1X7T494_AMPQE